MSTYLYTKDILPGPNDRTKFLEADTQKLADSIKSDGLIEPIILRPHPTIKDKLEIVAGERRFRAITLLKWQFLELGKQAIVKDDLTSEQASAIMLAENVGRVQLDPIDEGRAYQSRIDTFGWTIETITIRCGVSTQVINSRLKLLKLRPDVQALIKTGQLKVGYATILADADLDMNRQNIAIKRLSENPNPTPSWFRRVVNELAYQKSAAPLITEDLPLFTGKPIDSCQKIKRLQPPDPQVDKAPVTGTTLAVIIRNQIKFWQQAGADWDKLGKVFKKQECDAVVAVLQTILDGQPRRTNAKARKAKAS